MLAPSGPKLSVIEEMIKGGSKEERIKEGLWTLLDPFPRLSLAMEEMTKEGCGTQLDHSSWRNKNKKKQKTKTEERVKGGL